MAMTTAEPDHMYATINFEETELRLGLPGPKGEHHHLIQQQAVVLGRSCAGKRGFSETVDLKLNLSSSTSDGGDHLEGGMKNNISSNVDEKKMMNSTTTTTVEKLSAAASNNDPAKPPAKAQVVGWPPIRSFRKNVMAVQKSNDDEPSNPNKKPAAAISTTTSTTTTPAAVTTTSTATLPSAAAFVKVSMDGAPYLRKVDLKLYKSYNELSEALGKMFSSFTIAGNCGPNGMKDFMSESKLVDLLNGSEYVPSYEDKDGDWMLVGDVPWEMFVESCKRLRIMKGCEAIGLAPRAVEKCKNRC